VSQLSPACYNFPVNPKPVTLTIAEVEHIANLARLELTEEEKTRFSQQLSAILDYIAQLQSLDTAHILPTSSVLPVRSALRSDDPRLGLEQEALFANAPKIEDHQFRVPPVLE